MTGQRGKSPHRLTAFRHAIKPHEFLYPLLLQGYDSVAVRSTWSWAVPTRNQCGRWAAILQPPFRPRPSVRAFAADPAGL